MKFCLVIGVPTASLMFKVAAPAAVAVGSNVSAIVQSPAALLLVPQFDVSLKSPGRGFRNIHPLP